MKTALPKHLRIISHTFTRADDVPESAFILCFQCSNDEWNALLSSSTSKQTLNALEKDFWF